MRINKKFNEKNSITLYKGDCMDVLKSIPDETISLIITSPPYCMGKAYEDPHDDIETFKLSHEKIFPEIYRVLKPGGSVCWQVGYHINNSEAFPLDYFVYDIFTRNNSKLRYPLSLRNRIIWTFGHGLNSSKRFSGRHETILWFTKGHDYTFDLDNIRVPQKYPGKRSYKGPNKGSLSGNPMGKNPSDIWDIPNVKAQHVEKTIHPCQFPVAIPQRLIKALTSEGDIVLDPFMGSGSTGVAAVLENRKFVGSEIVDDYYNTTLQRIKDTIDGNIKIREDVPVMEPNLKSAVAQMPEKFVKCREFEYEKEKEVN